MKTYSLTHLSTAVVLRNTDELVAHDRENTADLLAHLAEVESRKEYVRAGYDSMSAWAVHRLRMSEDAVYKRLQAAHAARDYPILFPALAEGRLHLSAVCLLAPHLSAENATGLVGAATHKTSAEVRHLLAQRFPRTELLPLVEVASSPRGDDVGSLAPEQVGTAGLQFRQLAPEQVGGERASARVTPIAARRFALHFSIGQGAHDKLRYAQELLSHEMAPGDIAGVFERALDELIRVAEKCKFAASDRPQRVARKSTNPRHIPNRVKREVWKRDGGQCTFVGEHGRRCEARTLVEYDHVEEVARGGRATVSGIRLRCRAHNQFTAAQTFGREFMANKREEARQGAQARAATQRHDLANARTQANARAEANARTDANARTEAADLAAAEARAAAARRATQLDVTPWLRKLGIRADEAQRLAKLCESIPDASLESRLKYALSNFDTKARLPLPAA